MSARPAEITQLLLAWGHGDEAALGRMIPLVQRELQQIARRCMGGERGGHSLQPTALVNEATCGSSMSSRCTGRTARTFSRWRRG